MRCHGHRRLAPIVSVCPRCGEVVPAGEIRVILPRVPYLAVCCVWCGHHGPLLSFARVEVEE